jgi:hypothetical protein
MSPLARIQHIAFVQDWKKEKSEGLQSGIEPAHGNFGGGLVKRKSFPVVYVSL